MNISFVNEQWVCYVFPYIVTLHVLLVLAYSILNIVGNSDMHSCSVEKLG